MKVYRIEHKWNPFCGPYNGHHRDEYACTHHIDKGEGAGFEDQPLPYDVGLTNMDLDEDLHFGFPSLRALKRWFDHCVREQLHDCRFIIKVFDISDSVVQIANDGSQCIFYRKENRATTTLSLLEV